MDKVLKWIDNHKKLTTLICIALIFVPVLIIHCLFKWNSGKPWIEADWDSGDVLGYFGDVLSFVGTVVLGIFAVSQTEKANRMNEKLLTIEKEKLKPYLDIDCSKLCNISLPIDISSQLSKYENRDRIVIDLLYTNKNRSGNTTDVGLLQFDVFNSGGSDIRRITSNCKRFYLSALDPYCYCEPIAVVRGNTNLKIGERKSVFVYIKREFETEEEFNDSWYEKNITKFMPYMEFEFTIETMSGAIYTEEIMCFSGCDSSMKNDGNTVSRELAILNINVYENE